MVFTRYKKINKKFTDINYRQNHTNIYNLKPDFKLMPHIHEKLDFCAETFIVNDNKVLLRIHDKLKLWLSIGGHIELDEDPAEAAIREVKEEVGLDIEIYNKHALCKENWTGSKEVIPPLFINRHKINDKHEHVAFIYAATLKNNNDYNKIIQQETEKSDGIKWFTLEEIENNPQIYPEIKYYSKKILELLSNK